jgi:Ni,Fe-hydrogenase III small subunit
MAKPRVAFFDFSSCEGCQLTVSNCEDELLALVSHIDIVNFREIMTERSEEYDIAFIEGSCTRESEVPRLQKIRETAKVVVALGAYAIGGINCLKNFHDLSGSAGSVRRQAHYFPSSRRARSTGHQGELLFHGPIDRGGSRDRSRTLMGAAPRRPILGLRACDEGKSFTPRQGLPAPSPAPAAARSARVRRFLRGLSQTVQPELAGHRGVARARLQP